jgi:hypothetical protein
MQLQEVKNLYSTGRMRANDTLVVDSKFYGNPASIEFKFTEEGLEHITARLLPGQSIANTLVLREEAARHLSKAHGHIIFEVKMWPDWTYMKKRSSQTKEEADKLYEQIIQAFRMLDKQSQASIEGQISLERAWSQIESKIEKQISGPLWIQQWKTSNSSVFLYCAAHEFPFMSEKQMRIKDCKAHLSIEWLKCHISLDP